MDRYQNLFESLDELDRRAGLRRLRFLEIGTYDGKRAARLVRHWKAKGPAHAVDYYGFDLFEDLTEARGKAELSKSRPPPPEREVLKELARAGASVQLFRGDTRETLPRYAGRLPPMDLVFQDGGHSLETTASDWEEARRLLAPGGIYLLDDYYENRDDFGCRRLVEALGRNPTYRVRLLEPLDSYAHTGLDVRMVRVTRWDSDVPREGGDGRDQSDGRGGNAAAGPPRV